MATDSMPARRSAQAPAPFRHLFGLLVALIALFPFSDTLWGRWLIAAITAVVFFRLFRQTEVYRRHRALSLVVTALIGIVSLSAAGSTDASGELNRDVLAAYAIVVATVLAVATVVTVRQVFQSTHVTVDTILGAVSIYLFIGLAFGYGYIAVDDFTAGGLFAGGHVATQGEHLYFSFVTLTTLGYGDLAPLAPAGRSLSMVEAILGQIVLVTLVAWLVGRFTQQAPQPR